MEKIARELDQTVSGYAYHGNALHMARDLPNLSEDDIECLDRWLTGTQTAADGRQLQRIAIKLRMFA